ncbi:MAG: MFS transporter [Anaerotruncus sp.]|nr:MFS transporter [Anaerotruncus sp.]
MERENSKFKFFYFIRYFADAFFYPFSSLYFLQKLGSNSNAELGLLLAITPILTIVVNPIWTYFVKDMKVSRIILQVMTIVEGLLIFAITQVSTLEAYAIIIGLIAVLCSPYVSIQDGFTATFANQNKVEYSGIRIWASISYVVATLIGGYLGVYVGYDVLFLCAGILFALTALIAIWIKPLEKPSQDVIEAETGHQGAVAQRRVLQVSGVLYAGDRFGSDRRLVLRHLPHRQVRDRTSDRLWLAVCRVRHGGSRGHAADDDEGVAVLPTSCCSSSPAGCSSSVS